MKLDPRQDGILQFLRREELADKKLGDYYLGTLYALRNYENPDRHAQAANSLVEILEKLYSAHPKSIRQSHRDTVEKIKRSLGKKNRCELTKEKLLVILDAIEGCVKDGGQVPSRSERMEMLFGKNTKLWRNLEEIKHHNDNCDNIENCLEELEDLLLEYQDEVTISDQQKIKELVESC